VRPGPLPGPDLHSRLADLDQHLAALPGIHLGQVGDRERPLEVPGGLLPGEHGDRLTSGAHRVPERVDRRERRGADEVVRELGEVCIDATAVTALQRTPDAQVQRR